MKKILLLFTALVLSLSLCSCSDDAEDFVRDKMKDEAKDNFKTAAEAMGDLVKEGQKNAEKRQADTQEAYEENMVKVNKTITTDCAEIKFKSYAILEQQFGNKKDKVIVMTFDYTNTDDYEWHFYTALNEVYQGGVYIPRALHTLEKETVTSIRQGTTLEVVTSYTLRNEDDPIELIFSNLHNESGEDDEIVFKFDI